MGYSEGPPDKIGGPSLLANPGHLQWFASVFFGPRRATFCRMSQYKLPLLVSAALDTMSDGLVTIRPPAPSDIPIIIAARDDEHRRWIGPGSDTANPTACVVVAGETVGWVDYDHDLEHDWLEADEVNVGYFVFPSHRGKGFATRAVNLLIVHLATATKFRTASVLIAPGNERSLAVAHRCGFEFAGDLRGQLYLTRSLKK